jgi:valyl-tRNA synthetase
MHDWCISRQLWWGHRIPVWYGPAGEVVCVGPDEQAPAEPGWTQDPDVLDTWFSSGLWPFSTLGWPEDTADLRKFYPTSVLVTGYDIIFFWVARMMLFGMYAMKDAPQPQPFDTVALHGLVRDRFGKKMSKSRGNTVDPLEWMDAYGSDALRFMLARGANPGADQASSEEWVAGARNFCNKLWNATRFALMNGADADAPLPPSAQLSTPDRWILSRLHQVLAEVDAHYENYEFAKLTDLLYHFAWDEVCDWYLELSKPSLADPDAAPATRAVLGHVLDQLLRALHPVTPFVTEALWTALTGRESVVIADWPVADEGWADPQAEDEIASLQQVVTEVRRFRSDQGLKPGQKVPAALDGLVAVGLADHEGRIRSLARLQEPGEGFAATATLPVGGVIVGLDLSGTIDVPAERRRLEKDLAAAGKERDQTAAKLGNEAFLSKAPDAVVAKVRARLAAAESDLNRLTAQLAALPSA